MEVMYAKAAYKGSEVQTLPVGRNSVTRQERNPHSRWKKVHYKKIHWKRVRWRSGFRRIAPVFNLVFLAVKTFFCLGVLPCFSA
jgi:hypothetical protein